MDYDTLFRLRDALAAGSVTVFKAVITAVRVDGAVDTTPGVRARAGSVTYDILPADTDELFDTAVLTGVTPENNRDSLNVRIRAARVGQQVFFVRFGEGQPNEFQYHLYVLTEGIAYVDCNGNPVE